MHEIGIKFRISVCKGKNPPCQQKTAKRQKKNVAKLPFKCCGRIHI
jgi:hypothetical protein